VICFRDTTFCASDCTKQECSRFYGDKEREAAAEWWGKTGAPVAFAAFHRACPTYSPRPQKETGE